MTFKQGHYLTVNTPIMFRGESGRLREFKVGKKLWVTSTEIDHDKGVVKLAPKGKTAGFADAFKISDVEKSLKED